MEATYTGRPEEVREFTILTPEEQATLTPRMIYAPGAYQAVTPEAITIRVSALSDDITRFEVDLREHNARWETLIIGNEFIGTEEQYAEYVKEANSLATRSERLREAADRVNADVDSLERVRADQERLRTEQEQESARREQESTLAEFKKTYTQLPDGNWMRKADLVVIQTFSPDLYKVLTEQGYSAYAKEFNKQGAETIRQILEARSPANIGKEIAISMVPVWGTTRYAKQVGKDGLSGMERVQIAGSAMLDILTIVPLIGQLSAAARATKGLGMAGRVSAAGREATRFALAEVRGPFSVVKNLRQSLKVAASPVETVLRPSKIPLSALELSYTTVRLPISVLGDVKIAEKVRDISTMRAIRGQRITTTFGGTTVELDRVAIQKLATPVVMHGTPDVRPYLDGLTVKRGPEGRGVFVAPNLHTRFAASTAFGVTPKGGVKGALLIRDEKVIKALTPSRKIGRVQAEIEYTIPSGVRLPKPSQILTTRLPTGDELKVLVFGKPFTPAEVAKLKFMGSLDTVKQIFTSPAKISKLSKYADEISVLSGEARSLKSKAKILRRQGRTADALQLEAKERILSRRVERLSARANRVDTLVRLAYVNTQSSSPLERWERAAGRYRRVGTGARQLPRIDVPDRVVRVIRGDEPPIRAIRVSKGERAPAPPRDVPEVPMREVTSGPPRVPPPRVPSRIPPPRSTSRVPPTGRVAPPRVSPRPTRPPAPPKPPGLVAPTLKGGRKEVKLPRGAIAWRQGLFWKYIDPADFSTGKKPQTLPRDVVPVGAKFTDMGTPQDTIQMIGEPGASVPDNISIDLGAVDVVVCGGGERIEFRGKGLETDIGERVVGPTKGMSVGDGGGRYVLTRKGSRYRRGSHDTTLRGVRL